MNLFDVFEKLITEHGSSSVLRDHLALLREKPQALEKEIAELKRQKAELEQRLAECQRQLAAKSVGDEFVNHRGASFKRMPGGGYDLAVYCFRCHNPMSSMEGVIAYHCARCDIMLDFARTELQKVLSELPKS